MSDDAAARKLTFKTYLGQSKDLFASILFVIPVFVLYQIGLLATGGMRNGVDFVSDILWTITDRSLLEYIGINVGILIAFGLAAFFLRKRGSLNLRVWPWLIAESTLYAIFFGAFVVWLMSLMGLDALLAVGGSEPGVVTSIVLSLGAGVYEETVFRLLLMGGLYFAGVKLTKLPPWLSAVAAVIISSFVFSGVHYIGELGDAFTLGSFLFRFFAGVVLAAIFYLRGFAVAVYTHAIYDIIVMVLH